MINQVYGNVYRTNGTVVQPLLEFLCVNPKSAEFTSLPNLIFLVVLKSLLLFRLNTSILLFEDF